MRHREVCGAYGAPAVLLLAAMGCGTGQGGHITVPCDEARCNERCVASGAESGACRDETCVCIQPIDIPPGLQHGLSSGGFVQRESPSYQLSITVGPVSVGGTTSSGRSDLELGLQPMTDPERLRPAGP